MFYTLGESRKLARGSCLVRLMLFPTSLGYKYSHLQRRFIDLNKETTIRNFHSVCTHYWKKIHILITRYISQGVMGMNFMLLKGNTGVNIVLVSSWKHLCQKRCLRSLIPTVLCIPKDKVHHLTLCSCTASAAGMPSLSYHMEKSFKINLKASWWVLYADWLKKKKIEAKG